MKRTANILAKIFIVLGVIAVILSIIAHAFGSIMEVGHWGFITGGISMFLLAIGLNTLQLTE